MNSHELTVADYVGSIRDNGRLLSEVAAGADVRAEVPTCPGWTLGDVLRHLGYVHRWAARYVGEGLTERVPRQTEPEQLQDGPADAAVVAWYREGLQTLLAAISGAPPDLACWTFMDAPSPLVFWARRQAHETEVHRVDVEQAAGEPVTPIAADLAIDGIDEMLTGFARFQRRQLRADPPASLVLVAADSGRRRRISMGPDGSEMGTDEGGEATCTVSATASDLFLLLWNRRGLDGLDVTGDRSVLERWRTSVQVRWA